MKRKTSSRPKFRPYPQEQGYRGGCKVAWHYYDKLEDAQAASKAAIHNAQIQWDLGYDFGYCSPGSIRRMDNPSIPNHGRYEVCIP